MGFFLYKVIKKSTKFCRKIYFLILFKSIITSQIIAVYPKIQAKCTRLSRNCPAKTDVPISRVCINGKYPIMSEKVPMFAAGINTPPRIIEIVIIIEQSGPACFSVLERLPIKTPKLMKKIADAISASTTRIKFKESVSPKISAILKKIIVWSIVMGRIVKTKLRR